MMKQPKSSFLDRNMDMMAVMSEERTGRESWFRRRRRCRRRRNRDAFKWPITFWRSIALTTCGLAPLFPRHRHKHMTFT